MKISANKVVEISYTLKIEGKVIDEASAEKPLDYIQGMHMLIPMLERELEGKETGDTVACTVPPEEAYGPYDLKKVFDIPKSSFMVDGKLREDLLVVGKYIPLLNSAGEVCRAMVVDIKEEMVTMDFNDPFAGKTLDFTATVVSVREATEKELTEGLHGEFLPHECGGGCGGGCHGGCHGEGGCHHEEGEGCCGGHKEGEGCCGKGDGSCHHHHEE